MAANSPQHDKAQALLVFAPSERGRVLKLNEGRTWNSAEAGVVFFETTRYGDFTNGMWIANLLQVLARVTSVRHIGLRSPAQRIQEPPSWLSQTRNSNGVLTGYFDAEHVDKLIELFDATASYGDWDFYGLGSDRGYPTALEPLLVTLDNCKRYRFMVEIDLDAMLLGYVAPESNLNGVLSALSHIGTGKT